MTTGKIGFGIDLAGYTTGKSTIAFVEIDGRVVKATLLLDSAFSRKRKSSDSLREVLSEEAAVLRSCLEIGPVAVDIPIDLQGLPFPPNPEYIWQLTRRPIDYAVNAMPALADRIGAPVARFAAIMREGNFDEQLGRNLFEAYPAGTLKMLEIEAGSYKGPKGKAALTSLCATLKIEPHVKTDDDIDAIICAITAATAVDGVHDAAKLGITGPLPRGFRIPNSLSFDKIQILPPLSFENWIQKHAPAR